VLVDDVGAAYLRGGRPLTASRYLLLETMARWKSFLLLPRHSASVAPIRRRSAAQPFQAFFLDLDSLRILGSPTAWRALAM